MKVGDLVKVYDFSHEARRRLIKEPHATELKDLRVDAHYVGLVVGATDNDPKYRRVLRSVDGEREVYNVNRIEVIA